uniref:Uncharacterized protein n=1 Tax=Lepeophtheirus salmonis TaxID=72036 RepID=A0A0K2TGC4_LEPSM
MAVGVVEGRVYEATLSLKLLKRGFPLTSSSAETSSPSGATLRKLLIVEPLFMSSGVITKDPGLPDSFFILLLSFFFGRAVRGLIISYSDSFS